jgi:hypothetical protein
MRDCSGSVFLSKLSSCSLALSHTPVCRVLLCYFFSFFCCRCCFPLLIRFVCVCVCVFYSVFVLLVRRKFGMVFCFVLCVQSFCVVSAVSREGGGDADFCNWVKNGAGEMAQVCNLGGHDDDSSLLRSSRRGRREARNTGFSVFCIYIQFRFCFFFVTRVWRWRWSLETGFFSHVVKCVVQLLERFVAMEYIVASILHDFSNSKFICAECRPSNDNVRLRIGRI